MSKMGLYDPFGYLKHKLWPKEGSRIELAIWLPTIKSQESSRFLCVHGACHISLKSFRRELQLCFKHHFNRRSTHKVMGPQSRKSRNFGNLETKCHLDVGLVERHKVYYKGEGDGFPQVRAVVSLVSLNFSWFVLTPKMLKLCINQLVIWFVQVHVSNWCLSFFLVPILELQHAPLPPKCYEPGNVP
jgi:hypothetical protein